MMNINSLKRHQVMPDIKRFKIPDVLKLCKENSSSFTKKFLQNTIGLVTPGKMLLLIFNVC